MCQLLPSVFLAGPNLEHPHTSPSVATINIYIIYLQVMSDIPTCEVSLVTAAAVHLFTCLSFTENCHLDSSVNI